MALYWSTRRGWGRWQRQVRRVHANRQNLGLNDPLQRFHQIHGAARPPKPSKARFQILS